jgi:hypothetical protein
MEPQIAEQPTPVEYIPTKQEALRQYEINIQFLSRGCVIRVGCKSIPFESIDLAMRCLNDYIADPYKQGKEWERILS